MKKLSVGLVFLFFLSISTKLNAQWARSYGGSDEDRFYSIRQTNDGGYICAGETRSFGAGIADIWILKLASDGAIEWQKTYGGSGLETARSIIQTSDGGYIIAGESSSFYFQRMAWILKLKQDGAIEWEKAYGEGYSPYAVAQTSDGGYIVAGKTSPMLPYRDIWILKLASDGAVEWQKTYGGDWDDWAESVIQTSDGGCIVAGMTFCFGAGSSDIWILKLASDGAVEWQKTYGGSYSEIARSIIQTSDGGYIVAGHTLLTPAAGGDKYDFWILKLTSDGAVNWQKAYGGIYRDEAESIVQTSDGGYIVAGSTWPVEGPFMGTPAGKGALVLKLQTNGEIEWQRIYGGSDSNGPLESAYSILQTSDGGYIIAGESNSFGHVSSGKKGANAMVLKLLSNGSIDSSCDIVMEANVKTAVTSVSPANTSIIPMDTNIILSETNASVQNTNATPVLLCQVPKYVFNILANVGGEVAKHIDPPPGTYKFYPETSVYIVIMEDIYYEFSGWTGDVPQGHENDDRLSVYIDSDKSITANFIRYCSLSIEATSGGSTDPPPDSYRHNYGNQITIRAISYPDYEFKGWSGDVTGKDNPITITMDSHKYVKATFSEKKLCFIATAAYSSPSHPHVIILRNFKDKYLVTNKIGHKLVDVYYRHSPSAAEWISKHKVLKTAVRISLLPLIAFSCVLLHFGPIFTTFIIGLSLLISVFLILHWRRKTTKA